MKKNNILQIIIVALIVGIASFYGGMQYQKNQNPTFNARNTMMGGPSNRQLQGRGNTQFARPIAGEILSVEDDSLTLKIQDGSSKIIIISDQTAINKASSGVRADLKNGESITVFGKENSDGSLTAQNISIGGMMFRGRTAPVGENLPK